MAAYYLRIALRSDSVVRSPEKLYREKKLLVMVVVASVVTVVALLAEIPTLDDWLRMQKPISPPTLESSGSRVPEIGQ